MEKFNFKNFELKLFKNGNIAHNDIFLPYPHILR